MNVSRIVHFLAFNKLYELYQNHTNLTKTTYIYGGSRHKLGGWWTKCATSVYITGNDLNVWLCDLKVKWALDLQDFILYNILYKIL